MAGALLLGMGFGGVLQVTLFVPWQGLHHGQPECEPLHGERALAVLHPVVRRCPLGHLRQLPRPPQGAFPHLAHGKHPLGASGRRKCRGWVQS